MKKTILWLLLLSFVLSVSAGCQKKEEEISIMYHIASYETLDAFAAAIKQAKQKQANNETLTEDDKVLVGLETVYKPSADIPSCTMYKIDVSKYFVRYCPDNIENPNNKTSDELLFITFQRPEDGVNQFDQIVEEHREENLPEPNEDGVIYDPAYREILFPMGTSFGYVRVLESMNNYETILPLCQYEVLEIAEAE